MKRKFIKKTVSVLLSVLLVLTLSLGISAHEMYYQYGDGSSENTGTDLQIIELRWINSLNGKAYLRMNGSGLGGASSVGDLNYLEQFDIAYNAWNNCADSVIAQKVTSNITVAFSCPSGAEWASMMGQNADTTFGYTVLKSSDGVFVKSFYTASISSRNITYASIYLHPNVQFIYVNNGMDSLDMRHTIVHEAGHALTLGHSNTGYSPTSAASVMQQGTFNYYLPQSHDIGDVRAKYG